MSKASRRVFLRGDQRTREAKRWMALRAQFLEEINGGELERLSETTKLKLHALCDVALQLEVARDRVVQGDAIDPATINRLARTLSALSLQLGLEE